MAYGNRKMTPAVKKKSSSKKKKTSGNIPKGMHRMPDGRLMKNSAHKKRK